MPSFVPPLSTRCVDPRSAASHGDAAKTPQSVLNFGRKWARGGVIAHNETMKQAIVDLVGIPAHRISMSRTSNAAMDQLPPTWRRERREVLFFGRIWKYKGLDHLIRAQPLISKCVPDAKIVIAGCGEDFAPYRSAMTDPERFEVHNEFVSEEKQAELLSTGKRCCLALHRGDPERCRPASLYVCKAGRGDRGRRTPFAGR